MSRRVVVAAKMILTLGACARIAGLEEPDAPRTDTPAGAQTGATADAGSFPVNNAGAVISPLKLDVTTTCAVASETAYVGIENKTDQELPYEITSPKPGLVSLKDDQGASVGTVKGTVPARNVKIVYTRVLSSTPGTASGEIYVTTGTTVQRVPIDITVNGGLLTLSPPLIDFGQVRQNTGVPDQTVELTNTGNQEVDVSAWLATPASTDFTMSTTSLRILPGETAKASATFVAGDASSPLSADFTPQTVAPTCAAAPTLTLKGQRVNQDVTVNPATIGFGDFDCGSSPNVPNVITISNYAIGPVPFTVTLDEGSALNVTPASGIVGGGKSGTVTVNVNPVGTTPGSHTETIKVAITAGVDAGTRTVATSLRVVGAVVDFQPVTLSSFATNGTKSFTVTNTGNAFVALKTTSSDPAFQIVDNTDHTPLYPPGDFFPNALGIDVKFVATAKGTYASDVTTVRTSSSFPFPKSGALCNAATVVKASATIP